MRKRVFICVLAMLVLLTAATAFAETKQATPAIAFAKDEISVYTGEEYILPVSAIGITQPITYTSSDQAIATVAPQGIVKGVQPGTVYITASTLDGATANCEVTVKQTVVVEALTIKPQAMYIAVDPDTGEAKYWTGREYTTNPQQLTIAFTPEKTTQKNVTYTTSANHLIAVDNDGTVSVIGTLAKGETKTVKVTATAKTNQQIKAEIVITLVAGDAAWKKPVYQNGKWYDENFAPRVIQFSENGVKANAVPYGIVKGIRIYTDGAANEHVVRAFLTELENVHPALASSDVEFILFTNNDIGKYFGDLFSFSAIGIASTDIGDKGNICINTLEYDRGAMIHELMHVWDDCTMNALSLRKPFTEIYLQEWMQTYRGSAYHVMDQCEFLAFGAEDYFLRNNTLRQKAPLLTALLDKYFAPKAVMAEQEAA